jgi:hypothetical protein
VHGLGLWIEITRRHGRHSYLFEVPGSENLIELAAADRRPFGAVLYKELDLRGWTM